MVFIKWNLIKLNLLLKPKYRFGIFGFFQKLIFYVKCFLLIYFSKKSHILYYGKMGTYTYEILSSCLILTKLMLIACAEQARLSQREFTKLSLNHHVHYINSIFMVEQSYMTVFTILNVDKFKQNHHHQTTIIS